MFMVTTPLHIPLKNSRFFLLCNDDIPSDSSDSLLTTSFSIQAGGPKIDMKYGRLDAKGPEDCSPEGNLPDAEAAPTGNYGTDSGTASTIDTTPGGHLRKVRTLCACLEATNIAAKIRCTLCRGNLALHFDPCS